MFVTGPEVIRTVTHEEVSKEELGGASTHAAKSGVCHFTVATDAACLAAIRELLSYLPSNNLDDPPSGTSDDDPNRESEALDTLVPDDPHKPYDIKQLIAAVVDDGKFLEVHAQYARNIVVGFARFGNRSVGIVANQPAWLAGACWTSTPRSRGARFVRFCDAFNIPLVTFEDVPGFPARHQPGVWRHHQARCEAPLRLRRGDGAEDHRHHPQGLRRRLLRDVEQAPAHRRQLRLARRRRSPSWVRKGPSTSSTGGSSTRPAARRRGCGRRRWRSTEPSFQTLRRRRARLRRRHHRAAAYAAGDRAGVASIGGQAVQRAAEEARQHPAVKGLP